MLRIERQDELLEILRQRRYATVEELAEALYASAATVRRDLQALQNAGLVARTHGGASLLPERSQTPPVSLRDQTHAEEKALIGRMAAELVQDGDTVMMDASTTVLHAARLLWGRQNLTVITNSLPVAQQLRGQSIRIYLTGGLLLENSDAFAGSAAEACVRRFNADILLFSCAAVSNEGMISDYSEQEVALRQVMLAQARQRVFLCDSSKLGRKCLYNLCPVREVDRVLCDKPLPDGWQRR